jgi:tetratricopeptide (TPR) repeat protein
MYELDLESAVSEIHQACEGKPGSHSPFFFIVGAGLSAPTIPIASEIEQECREIARGRNRLGEPKGKSFLESYSHWFEQAWPHAQQRQEYLRKKIENRQISPAALRLAHLLLDGAAGNLVVTPNFDDFLSKALQLFGRPHIICDHPDTISRVAIESNDIKIVHVHGTYWFYDCCNLKGEIAERAESASTSGTVTVPAFLEHLLWNRSPIVLGYSGWEGDAIMTALHKRMKNAMGFNIYWFCYKRSDYDVLPPWLKDDPRVRSVVPKVEPAISSKKSTELGLSAPQVAKAGTEMVETLPAVRVLDLLNRSFKLSPPPLTESPLEFFAAQLTKTVFPEAVEQQENDFYDFKNIIATIQRAAVWSKGQEEARSDMERALEDLRNAVRRSEYREAIKIAAQMSQTHASDSQLEELLSAAFTAADSLNDNSLDELKGYEIVCDISENLASKLSMSSFFKWVRAMYLKGVVLGELKRWDEAIVACDEVVRHFGEARELAVREQVARALRYKGFVLGESNRHEESIVASDDVVRRFGEATEPAVREQVAIALFNKGIALRESNRHDKALLAYDDVVRRFGEASEPAVRALVAMALNNKGAVLAGLKRPEEAIVAHDEVLTRFGNATEPAVREQVAMALFDKGVVLGELKRPEEAIVAYDEVLRRFSDAKEPAALEQAVTLNNKGFELSELKRPEEAVVVYDEVLRRFGEATEPAVREQAARALRDKGVVLRVSNRYEEAILAFDEVAKRFGEAMEPAMREQVAIALFSKGVVLGELKRPEDAIVVYDEVVGRFGEATEPAVREQVAMALNNKGVVLGGLKRPEEAIVAHDEVLRRFGNAMEPAVLEQVAMALFDKGVVLEALKRHKEAIVAYDEVVRQFGDATDLAWQRIVARTMLSQVEILKKIRQPKKSRTKIVEIIQRYGEHSDSEIQEFVTYAKSLMPEDNNQQQ